MTEHRLDTRGMLCPRPIIELSKAVRRAARGELIHIVNDDAAFPLDLRAWCEGMGHELTSLESVGHEHRATVRKLGRGAD